MPRAGAARSCTVVTGTAISRKRESVEGIPVVTVDEEIYRLVPTFLLCDSRQVRPDALARGGAVALRSSPRPLPPPWLALQPERPKCTGTHNKKGRLPATSLEPAPTNGLRPPDLIIQDELHLIAGPLGTLVGLYETADRRTLHLAAGGNKVRPKVIASTATTRRAAEQVHQLFCRQVEIFPPLGLDARDNFFARQRSPEDKPGRRYMGVCAPGRSPPVRSHPRLRGAPRRQRSGCGTTSRKSTGSTSTRT